jgi:hypothetical protein
MHALCERPLAPLAHETCAKRMKNAQNAGFMRKTHEERMGYARTELKGLMAATPPRTKPFGP